MGGFTKAAAEPGRGAVIHVCRHPGRGRGEVQAGLAAVGFMLGILGTVACGREDILGSRVCDTSQIILCEYLLTLLFMKPAPSKGM